MIMMGDFQIQTYGSHTIRYHNYVLTETHLFYPVGSSLYKYNYDLGKKQASLKLDNIITYVIVQAENLVVLTYGGLGILVAQSDLSILSYFPKLHCFCVNSAAVHEQLVAVSCLIESQKTCVVAVFSVQNNIVENVTQIPTLDCTVAYNHLGELILISQTNVENDNQHSILRLSKLTKDLQHDGNITREIPIVGKLFLSSTNAYHLTIATTRRFFYCINPVSLDLDRILLFPGSGCMGAYHLDHDNILYISPGPKQVMSLDINSLPTASSLSTLMTCVDDSFLEHVVSSDHIKQLNAALYKTVKHVLIANEMGLFIHSLETRTLVHLSFCESFSTFCGLDQNHDSTQLAVGDLEGKIKVKSQVTGEITASFSIPDGVRVLQWEKKSNVIVVGTLGGDLYVIYQKGQAVLRKIANLGGSVNCISVIEIDDLNLILVGTSCGRVHVIDASSYHVLLSCIVHHKQANNQDSRFGSLKYFAEVWSIASFAESALNFKDDAWNLHFITGSEDQTVRLSHLRIGVDGKHVIMSEKGQWKNHTLAVTSVDWKRIATDNRELFVTCSDDRSFCVYHVRTEDIVLIANVSTENHIYYWYTLTYVKIDMERNRVVMTTQNGYILIYSLLDTSRPLVVKKIHMGGVEGLSVRKRIVTCSSDLTVNIISFP